MTRLYNWGNERIQGNMIRQCEQEDILRGYGEFRLFWWRRDEDTATTLEQKGGVTLSVNSTWGTKHLGRLQPELGTLESQRETVLEVQARDELCMDHVVSNLWDKSTRRASPNSWHGHVSFTVTQRGSVLWQEKLFHGKAGRWHEL